MTGKLDFILEHGFRDAGFVSSSIFFVFLFSSILSLFAYVAFFLRHTMPLIELQGVHMYTAYGEISTFDV